MVPSPKVSILCAVRNEKATIDEHLASLVQQNYRNKEIIVIDDESTDGTTEIIQRYVKCYRFIRTYRISHVVGGSHTDVRLFGIKKTTGSIIFVVDADAYYDSNYLERCMKILHDPRVGGVIGKMRMWNPSTFISKYRDAWYTYRFDNEALINREILKGKVAAWVFRRSVYDAIGGYDPKNRYGEDVDLAHRIQKAGYRVVYEPKALWYHKWEDTFSRIIKKHFAVGTFNFYHRRKDMVMWMKVLYFLSFLPLLALSFFSSAFMPFVFLHIAPLALIALHRTYLCRRSRYWYYMFLYPFMTYLINIPYSVGFLSQAFRQK